MLTDEMKEAIEKNLPAQIGAVLQERLAEVDSLKQRLDTMATELTEAESTIDGLREREQAISTREVNANAKDRQLETDEQALETRAREVGDAEHSVELATLRASMSEIGRSELRSVLTEVFHSPMYRKTVSVSGSHDMVNPEGGGYVNTTPIHHDESTTTEVTES